MKKWYQNIYVRTLIITVVLTLATAFLTSGFSWLAGNLLPFLGTDAIPDFSGMAVLVTLPYLILEYKKGKQQP